MIWNKKKLVTHNGSFHTDDIFACATLALWLEKSGKGMKVYRTRDEKIIKEGDYVFDVGGVYDPEKNLFDHHQAGGAGKRENGIEYSSFGLVWKKFGMDLCDGGEEVFQIIDDKLVAPIDAFDNGFDLVENIHKTSPYFIQHFFFAMRPALHETKADNYKMFLESVQIAKKVLEREMIHTKDAIVSEKIIEEVYKKTEDKRILVLNEHFHDEEILSKFQGTLFVVYPRPSDNLWGIRAVRDDFKSFKNRRDFPKEWAGLRNGDLQKITGVSDAFFCHKGLFLAVTGSKESAIKLAELAL